MWICSQLGFYSIVHKDNAWHVRARTKTDINNLIRAAGVRVQVQRWPEADYRWRVLVQVESLGKIFAALAKSITYPNFKDRIFQVPDQRIKLTAYGNLWRSMLAIQEDCE